MDQRFETVPAGVPSLDGEADTIDWFCAFNYPIGGETSTRRGLSRRREAIQNIVAPHVTTDKTQHAIRFKGARRYVKQIEDEGERHKVWHAIEVLQGIYHIEEAWREGDIEDAIRLSYGVGWLDTYLEISERFESPLFEDVVAYYLAKDRGKNKKGKSKLKDVPTAIIEVAYAKNRHKRNWLEKTRDELHTQHKCELVSARTLRRELVRRRILDK
jgi:hypothetical protein